MAFCVAMAFSGGFLVELSVCVVSIALKRFDCIYLIGPDTRGSYKYGHCDWIGGEGCHTKTVPSQILLDPESGCWGDNPH